ncbi:dienelactone hydrolase family protein [Agrococcus sp. HG114]|uniref:dienelactone hydrolase family protein n=1 Tax=Agrococcus sp. HG114 TaxID=2969757 RepID=UPI00215A782C|nr:alpha/beta fold hydrolase [Agrococcus sp. HG114]MCR8671839.1 alpha/beta fold hydrolase [Agrococcus sp. HG114]
MAIETTDDTATRWYGAAGDPVVVLLHDWNGRLPWIDAFGRRLADEGFRVAVPDLYAGRSTRDDGEAGRLLQERYADLEGAHHIVSETLGEARAGGSRRAGIVGFSMGSTIALMYAAQHPTVEAIVAYYGAPFPGIEAGPRVPVLFQLAASDDWTGREAPEDYRARLAAEGYDDVHVRSYPDSVHGFQNADVPKYSRPAAEAAWAETKEFLRSRLNREP